MTFDNYHEETLPFATYPDKGNNLIYTAMGVAGEAGEFLDKIKKQWRNVGCEFKQFKEFLTPEQRQEILKELGDVLWYINASAYELDSNLNEVATINIDKLRDRYNRGVVKGVGDNR